MPRNNLCLNSNSTSSSSLSGNNWFSQNLNLIFLFVGIFASVAGIITSVFSGVAFGWMFSREHPIVFVGIVGCWILSKKYPIGVSGEIMYYLVKYKLININQDDDNETGRL